MTLPRLNAEAALGSSLGVYASGAASPATSLTSPAVAPMGLLDGLFGGGGLLSGLGGVLGQVASKLPCLVACGLPNAAEIAFSCGIDPGCWISKGTQAGAGCISQCLNS